MSGGIEDIKMDSRSESSREVKLEKVKFKITQFFDQQMLHGAEPEVQNAQDTLKVLANKWKENEKILNNPSLMTRLLDRTWEEFLAQEEILKNLPEKSANGFRKGQLNTIRNSDEFFNEMLILADKPLGPDFLTEMKSESTLFNQGLKEYVNSQSQTSIFKALGATVNVIKSWGEKSIKKNEFPNNSNNNNNNPIKTERQKTVDTNKRNPPKPEKWVFDKASPEGKEVDENAKLNPRNRSRH